MMILAFAAVLLGAAALMEWVAWATHKYVMHGFLWSLHRDHHIKDPGFFEKNDAFFLIFALPGSGCIIGGTTQGIWYLTAIGFGITLYGIIYFLVHEVFIHRRFNWFKNTNNAYFRAVLKAHKMHHKHLSRHEGENFGLLLFPLRYLREELGRKNRQKQKLKTGAA